MDNETRVELDEIFSRVSVMRIIVARLLGHEFRKYADPDDLFRPMAEGLETLLARQAQRTGYSPMDYEEKMRAELEWFFSAARTAR